MTVPSTLKDFGSDLGLDLSTMLIPSSQISGNISGGVDNTPSYTIYKTGANFAARGNLVGLSDVAANADAAAVFQSCMDNINSSTTPRGLIIFAPNTTFTWSSVPTLRRTYASGGVDDNKWLRVLGSGGSVIQLSAAGKSFLVCNRQADYDGFCGIEIGYLEIDANNVVTNNNILFGTRVNNNDRLQRCDFRRVWLHDYRIYNAPVATVAQAQQVVGVGIACQHIGADTQNVIEDIRIERFRQDGGQCAVYVFGFGGNGGIQMDRIVVRDFYHDSGIDPATDAGAHIPSSCMQLGGFAGGEQMIVENGFLAGSNDDGLEVNGLRTITVRNVTVERTKTESFFVNNFNPIIAGDTSQQHTQVVLFENCKVRVVSLQPSSINHNGWTLQPVNNDIGTVILRGCQYVVKVAQNSNFGGLAMNYGSAATQKVHQLIVEDCVFDHWMNNSTVSDLILCSMFFYDSPRRVSIRNLRVNARGARSSSGQIFVRVINPSGVNTHWDIDGLELVDFTTGRGSDSTKLVHLGEDTVYGQNVMSGVFRGLRYRIEGAGGDTAPRGVFVFGTGSLTLRKLIVDVANFAGLAGDSGLVTFTGVTNAANVWIRNFIGRVQPPTEITFTPGATTVSAQYVGNYEGLMTITGGTVTVVEVSTDNATFRQVAAGTNVSFYIDHGMYVRLTYTVAPTCKVLPRR